MSEKVLDTKNEDILTKYDKDSNTRKLKGKIEKLIFALALLWSTFQLYTAIFGTFPSSIQRATHLGAAAILVFLLYPAAKSCSRLTIPWYDYLLSFSAFVVSAYQLVFFEDLYLRAGLYDSVDMDISL